MLRILSLLLVSIIPCVAELPFDFARTPGKLSKAIVPLHYDVRIEADVENSRFSGTVAIEIEVRKPTSELRIHSLGLDVQRASLGETSLTAKTDDTAQMLTLSGTRFETGNHLLRIAFTGALSERPEGLYLTRYQQPDGKWSKALVTQMQAIDARRMMPCWDEPAFRASVSLSVVVPAAHTALSNMPVENQRTLEDGRREWIFSRTPAMPIYLLALASAEFESIEDEVDGVKLRILATPGKRAQMAYAMESTKKLLPWFNTYFGVKYPLPKLDQVALPSVAAGGMENWGCIIYTDTALLWDPHHGSQAARERTFDIVAHEIAHQWFGNLVTMAWWDNLWLNEGFASWMAAKASDTFNPTWEKWLLAAGGRESAMRLDARSTTHPIQQPILEDTRAMEVFDEITYQKGQAFLRMLEAWLGEDKFRDGLRLYFSRHALSNTTTADLWKALSESSGQDVTAMAAGWTQQPGFPVVITRGIDGRAILHQERFTIHQKAPQPLTWRIPVEVTAHGQRTNILLGEQPHALAPGLPIIANSGARGYFRVQYEGEAWAQLLPTIHRLPTADRLQLLQDTWALIQAGRINLPRWVQLASLLGKDTSPIIGNEIANVWTVLEELTRGTSLNERVRERAIAFALPRFETLGWQPASGETLATAGHRAQLIRLLSLLRHPLTIREATERTTRYLQDDNALPGDTRAAILQAAARHATPALWQQLHNKGRSTTDTERKLAIYHALTAAEDPVLTRQTLALALTGELPSKLSARLITRVASESGNAALAWDFAKANLPALLALCAAHDADEYVANLFRTFSDAYRADELEDYTRANLPPSTAQATAIATDDIRFKSVLKRRLQSELPSALE